ALSLLAAAAWLARAQDNLVPDPSFEQPMPKNRWGHVFSRWAGWVWDSGCEFRVSDLARTGKHSLLMVGSPGAKIPPWPDKLILAPGPYRTTADLRALDIGTGPYGVTTEFMFAGKYMPLNKNGNFGWSKLTYVGDVPEKKDYAHPSFGLLATGYL